MLIFRCSSQSNDFEPVEVKEINVEISRDRKLLTPLQLEREYQDWILQMHERYDEETDSGEDQGVLIVSPANKKALGISSDGRHKEIDSLITQTIIVRVIIIFILACYYFKLA